MEKKNNLLTLKNSIETEIEKREKPLATIREMCDCFNDLLDNKSYETIASEVANWFKSFDFIKVNNKGIGFIISYRG